MLSYLHQAINYSNVSLLSTELSEIYMMLIDYFIDKDNQDSIQFYIKEFKQVNQKRKQAQLEDQNKLINSLPSAKFWSSLFSSNCLLIFSNAAFNSKYLSVVTNAKSA